MKDGEVRVVGDKRQLDEKENCPSKRLKPGVIEISDDEQVDKGQEQEEKDQVLIADLLEDAQWGKEEGEEDDLTPSQSILLSPSISYNPARYTRGFVSPDTAV